MFTANIADRVGAAEAIIVVSPAGTSSLHSAAIGASGRRWLWWGGGALLAGVCIAAWRLGVPTDQVLFAGFCFVLLLELLPFVVHELRMRNRNLGSWLAAARRARVKPFHVQTSHAGVEESSLRPANCATSDSATVRTFDRASQVMIDRIAYREKLLATQRGALPRVHPLVRFFIAAAMLLALFWLTPSSDEVQWLALLAIGPLVVIPTLLMDVNSTAAVRLSQACDTRQREGCCARCRAYLLHNVPSDQAHARSLSLAACPSCKMEWPLVPPAMPEEVIAEQASGQSKTMDGRRA